ncbi:MAG: hypothetical protein AAF371_02280 [Pseudomonadota bacterium]
MRTLIGILAVGIIAFLFGTRYEAQPGGTVDKAAGVVENAADTVSQTVASIAEDASETIEN